MILFASDLDNTLIFSYKKVIENPICVEKKDNKQLSFMTAYCYNMLQSIINKVIFVPITTRSLEQYNRIKLLKNSYPKYTLVCNGGILLVDNEIDNNWYNDTLKLIDTSISELNNSLKLLIEDKNMYLQAKLVDNVFVFGKTRDVNKTSFILKNNLDLDKVSINNNGDKIYVLPKILNKSTALNRLKKIVVCDYTICAGDSNFDIPMLENADLSIIPNNIYLEKYNKLITVDLNIYNFSDEILSIVHSIVN